MFAPVCVSPPGETPITLDDVKAGLRISGSDDDVMITALIRAVTARLDGWSGILGRALITQSWRQDFGCFRDCLRLPLAPVQSVTSVTYYDGDGVQQIVATSVYELLTDALGAYVALKSGQSWPATDDRAAPVAVTYVAGYGAASAVPADVRAAMTLMVGRLVAHARPDMGLSRESVQGVSTQEWANGPDILAAVDSLAATFLANHRRVGF